MANEKVSFKNSQIHNANRHTDTSQATKYDKTSEYGENESKKKRKLFSLNNWILIVTSEFRKLLPHWKCGESCFARNIRQRHEMKSAKDDLFNWSVKRSVHRIFDSIEYACAWSIQLGKRMRSVAEMSRWSTHTENMVDGRPEYHHAYSHSVFTVVGMYSMLYGVYYCTKSRIATLTADT